MNLFSLVKKLWARSPEYNFSAIFSSFRRKKDVPEYERLVDFPRFKETDTKFLDRNIRLVDAASFLFIYKELFEEEIYKFTSKTDRPFIIDGGANIGLSIIYFKKLYPEAKILGFEPDPVVFKALENNIKTFGFTDVTLLPKGLWKKSGQAKFYAEGSDGGRIALDSDGDRLINIETTSLRDYLNRTIDFLKLDIEGAETDVLEESKDLLGNVKNIFVEYHSFVKSPQNLDKLLQILKGAGFRYHIHHIGVLSKHPFEKVKILNSMDMQLNIFGFRA